MVEYLPFDDQFHLLLTLRLHPSGRAYTLQEVSQGTGLAPATISQMRAGRIQNPQLSTLRVLCQFFDIPLRYFETRTAEECYAILLENQPRDVPPGEITEIAFRAAHLSREALQDILTIIRWAQAAEQNRKAGPDDLPPLPRLRDSKQEDDEDGEG